MRKGKKRHVWTALFAGFVIFLCLGAFSYCICGRISGRRRRGFRYRAYYDVFSWLFSVSASLLEESWLMSLHHGWPDRRFGYGGLWICQMYVSGERCHVFLPDDPDGTAAAGDAGAELYHAGSDGSAGNGRRLIFPGIFVPLGTFLITQSFRAVPDDVVDVARLDGCGLWRILVQVAVPVARGGIVCAGLLTFLDAWNMVEQPIAYLRDFTRYPISVALAYVTPSESARQFVCCILVILPPLLLFSCFHREMVEGIVFGEEK